MPVMWYSILAGVAVKATAVVAVAWFTAVLLRGRSAAARHLVWTSAAAAVLALPLFTIGLPVLQVSAPSRLLPEFRVFSFSSTASAAPVSAVPGAATERTPTTPRTPSPWPADWRVWLVLLWAAGATVALIRMLAACAAIGRIRRSARPFADPVLAGALSQALGIRNRVDVLEASSGTMPMTFGVLRPFILIPATAAEWSAERRRFVLLHELAHVRREDVATTLFARTALCLYWWNPLAWIAWRSLVRERERAADDLVITAGARASEYAGHLLEIARGAQSCLALESVAAVAMVRPSQLEGRLRAILDARVNRNTLGPTCAVAVMLVVLSLVAPLAAIRAQEPRAQDTAQSQSQNQSTNSDLDALVSSATSQHNPEILENAAKAAQRSRSYDLALKLLQAAAPLRAEVSGPESVSYGSALMDLADLQLKRHVPSAETTYANAAKILGERPEAARARLHLGIAALSRENFSEAIADLRDAQRIDSSQAGLATMWIAVVRQREGDVDQAETLYRSALSQQDPNSAEAVTIRLLFSQFLRYRDRANEASELEKANAAKKRPPASLSEGVYQAGSPGVTPPSLLQKVEPEYSDEARTARLTGTELLFVEIGPDGRAHNPRVLQGLGLGLDENGIDAVSAWHFRPGIKDGQPVTVAATIEIHWRLL